jgi:hypothetical protein
MREPQAYLTQAVQPQVIDEPGAGSAQTPAVIDRIKLITRAYIQPVWQFTGHYLDGQSLELRVQALVDAHLI